MDNKFYYILLVSLISLNSYIFGQNSSLTYKNDSLLFEIRTNKIQKEYQTTLTEIKLTLSELKMKEEKLVIKEEDLGTYFTLFSMILAVVSIFIGAVGISSYRNQEKTKKEIDLELNTIRSIRKDLDEKSSQLSQQFPALKSLYIDYQNKLKELNKVLFTAQNKVDNIISEEQSSNDIKDIEEVEAIIREELNEEEISEQKIKEIYMEGHLKSANYAFIKEEWSDVILSIQSYLRYDQNDFQIYYKYGFSFFMIHEYELAVQAFRNALNINMTHCESIFGLIACYTKLKDKKMVNKLEQELISKNCNSNINPFY